MASGVTNKCRALALEVLFRNSGAPIAMNLALVTSAVVPTVDTNTFGELTEITAGNGYTTGGQAVARNATDFDSLVENDTLNQGELQLRNFLWTAAGGPIPASGSDALYAVLIDDNATIANREVFAWFDLGVGRSVTDTNALTIIDAGINATVGT